MYLVVSANDDDEMAKWRRRLADRQTGRPVFGLEACGCAVRYMRTKQHTRSCYIGCTFVRAAVALILPYQIKWNEKMAFQFKFIDNIIHYYTDCR